MVIQRDRDVLFLGCIENIVGNLSCLVTVKRNGRLVHNYSLPNDKISEWSKLKAVADDKINVTEKEKFVMERV